MVGQVVILNHFALHNYNGSLSLSSKPRATIQLTNSHPYQEYVDEVMRNHKDYEQLS
jgi:hypothetical protein